MRLAVPKERRATEARVAATPETVRKLIGLGLSVAVEKGAGLAAGIPDAAYSVNLSSNRMFVPVMLMALLALRWGPLVQKEGQAFTAVAGTLAAHHGEVTDQPSQALPVGGESGALA